MHDCHQEMKTAYSVTVSEAGQGAHKGFDEELCGIVETFAHVGRERAIPDRASDEGREMAPLAVRIVEPVIVGQDQGTY